MLPKVNDEDAVGAAGGAPAVEVVVLPAIIPHLHKCITGNYCNSESKSNCNRVTTVIGSEAIFIVIETYFIDNNRLGVGVSYYLWHICSSLPGEQTCKAPKRVAKRSALVL